MNDLKQIKGAKELSKKEQQTIKGGNREGNFFCLCSGDYVSNWRECRDACR